MSEKRHIIMNMEKELARSISTRAAVRVFFDRMTTLDSSEIVLDFQNVDAVSRSAAHEFIEMKFALSNKFKKNVTLINMNHLINFLMKAVTDHSINSSPKVRHVSSAKIDFDNLCKLSA